MILAIYPRTEGPLNDQFKEGDIFRRYPDSYSPGESELKRFLFVKIDNASGVDNDELVRQEFGVPPSGLSLPVIARQRKYRINCAAKLTPEEWADAQDPEVSVDVIVGVFGVGDIEAK